MIQESRYDSKIIQTDKKPASVHLPELRGNVARPASSHTTRVGLLRTSQHRQTMRMSTTMLGTSSLRSHRTTIPVAAPQQSQQLPQQESAPLFPQLEVAFAETRFTIPTEWKHSYRERRRQEQLD